MLNAALAAPKKAMAAMDDVRQMIATLSAPVVVATMITAMIRCARSAVQASASTPIV